jgi:7-carboxy-7-deazaguanine synthase
MSDLVASSVLGECEGARASGRRLRVNEIFYSLQGESSFAGRPCVLVRLTGCQMRCRWCDTPYSFYEGSWRSLEEIEAEVAGYGCGLVEITGGEPLLQPATPLLVERLCDGGYEVLVETGGGLDVSALDRRAHRILDVKCPGSGEVDGNRLENLDELRRGDEVKFVLADRMDYEWARAMLERLRRKMDVVPVHFSPVEAELPPRTLASWILEDRLPVRLQLQLHKVLWGASTRGV